MTITTEVEYDKAVEEFKALDAITPFTSPGSSRFQELDDAIEAYQDAKLIERLANDPEWQELMQRL